MHEAKAAAEVAKKYIEEACKQQREMCSHSLGYSSAVYIYPQDYDKMRDWISWTTLVNVDALAENGI